MGELVHWASNDDKVDDIFRRFMLTEFFDGLVGLENSIVAQFNDLTMVDVLQSGVVDDLLVRLSTSITDQLHELFVIDACYPRDVH